MTAPASLSGFSFSLAAQRVGAMSSAFEASPSPAALEGLRETFAGVTGEAWDSRHLASLLQKRPDREIAGRKWELHEHLLGLEGELRGLETRDKAFDFRNEGVSDDATHFTAEDVAPLVLDAHRFIRARYFRSFLRTARLDGHLARNFSVKFNHLRPYPELARGWRGKALCKPETELPGGSYALRGALYFLIHHLHRGLRPGNNAVAFAPPAFLADGFSRAARILGFDDIRIYLHRNTHHTLVNELKKSGAQTFLLHGNPQNMEDQARREATKNQSCLFLPSHHPLVAAGYATAGVEIGQSAPVQAGLGYSVIVPSADQSLLTGLSAYFRPRGTTVVSLVDIPGSGVGVLNETTIRREDPVVVVLSDRLADTRQTSETILSRAG